MKRVKEGKMKTWNMGNRPLRTYSAIYKGFHLGEK
jgi:hypothetical protein